MTSANKILIIEGGPPIGFSIQNFLWKNGWFQTQIFPQNIEYKIIQQLNPALIICSKTDKNNSHYKKLSYPIVHFDYEDIDDSNNNLSLKHQKTLEQITSILSNKEKFSSHREFLLIRQNGKLLNIPVPNILFVESDGNQVKLQTRKGKNFTFNNSLLKMNSILPNSSFLRIHKKYIVQYPLIESILPSSRKVVLQDYEIPIGRTFKDDLFSKFKMVS